jgi:hypothetical protein
MGIEGETDSHYQRHPILGMVLAIAGVFAGMPAAFTFLAVAIYGKASWTMWALGLGCLAFGLWGLWQIIFGARGRPGRLYRDRKR